MPATAQRRSATEIAQALVSALAPLQWAPAGRPPEPAFERIELFDMAALPRALGELLATEDRIAVVVPGQERFSARIEAPHRLVITRVLPAAILIADRVLGDRQAALYGSDANPGAVGLLELALPAVVGQLLPNPGGVVCQPVTAAIFDLAAGDPEASPGRAVIELDIECSGGTLAASLGPGPVI